MPIDYIVSSLQPLAFDGPAPYTWEQFAALLPDGFAVPDTDAGTGSARWRDLETQLRNAVAAARGGERFARHATGCDLHWRNRVAAAFQERDPLKRETLLDRIWWDAAGELTPPAAPLSRGTLETYAIRLRIALKRGRISKEAGGAAFDGIAQAADQKQRQQETDTNRQST
jgi:hypothetical protein